MSGLVIEANPLSRQQIRQAAQLVRSLAQEHLGEDQPMFPVVDFMERVLPRMDPEFHFEVLDVQAMGDDHGLTIPSQHVIKLRQDVYCGACAGKGRDRGTVAHEVGHYLLHDDIAFPRRLKESEIQPFRSAEWQAKAFAGELLVSAVHIQLCTCASDAAVIFGVSLDSAYYQWDILKKEGLI